MGFCHFFLAFLGLAADIRRIGAMNADEFIPGPVFPGFAGFQIDADQIARFGGFFPFKPFSVVGRVAVQSAINGDISIESQTLISRIQVKHAVNQRFCRLFRGCERSSGLVIYDQKIRSRRLIVACFVAKKHIAFPFGIVISRAGADYRIILAVAAAVC